MKVLSINWDQNRLKYAYNIVKERNPMGFLENSMSPLPDTLHKSPLDNIYLLKRSREQIQAQEIVDAYNKDYRESERWNNISDGDRPLPPLIKELRDIKNVLPKLTPKKTTDNSIQTEISTKRTRATNKKSVEKEIEFKNSLPSVPYSPIENIMNDMYYNQMKEK